MNDYITSIKKTFLFLLIVFMVPLHAQAMEKNNEEEKIEKLVEIINGVLDDFKTNLDRYRRDMFWLDVKFYTAIAAIVGIGGYYLRGIYYQDVLYNAITCNDIDTVREHVKKANLNKPFNEYGCRLLHHAVISTNNHQIVKILLENKANPNVLCEVDGVGNTSTPLMLAITNKKIAMIKVLLNEKANSNLRDAQGKTALFHTLECLPEKDVLRVVQMLVDHGAVCSNIDNDGNNILHMAAEKQPQICDRFLSVKRRLDKENEVIKTFLLCMNRKKHQSLEMKNKSYTFEVPPKPLLLIILKHAGISDSPYKRNTLASTGLLFEKNKEGKTPYDILIKKQSPLAETFKPTELQLVAPKIEYSNEHVWREQVVTNMLEFIKNNEIQYQIKSI